MNKGGLNALAVHLTNVAVREYACMQCMCVCVCTIKQFMCMYARCTMNKGGLNALAVHLTNVAVREYSCMYVCMYVCMDVCMVFQCVCMEDSP